MRLTGRLIAIGMALMVSSATAASASDIASPHYSYKSVITDGDAPGVPVPAPMPIPEHGVWYVRGDIGFATHSESEISSGTADYTSESLRDVGTAGVGVGFNFREHFRVDFTIDYRWDGVARGFDPVSATDHRTEFESIVGLGNIYYDFTSRSHFTPYLGFGIGAARHDTDDREVSRAGTLVTTGAGKEETALAVAAMAGFSYALDQGLMIDAGYRFLHLGDAEVGPTADGLHATKDIKAIKAHEFRVGIRYEIF